MELLFILILITTAHLAKDSKCCLVCLMNYHQMVILSEFWNVHQKEIW